MRGLGRQYERINKRRMRVYSIYIRIIRDLVEALNAASLVMDMKVPVDTSGLVQAAEVLIEATRVL